jgi:uncharacterized protein (DUF2062 family)
MVGSRDMKQKGIPGKSSFGHRFSNFWFRVETGVRLPDTQSGFRLYPLRLVKDIWCISRRYGYEVEILVRAAWRRYRIISLPVHVYYPEGPDRITHFRPFLDFTRVSLLNILLVIIALLWVRPLRYFKWFGKIKFSELFRRGIRQSSQHKGKFILSVMLGVFMGILPVWGYQTILAFVLAYLFRLNKIIAIVASNISIPPMIPFILYGSYRLGGLCLSKNSEIPFSRFSINMVGQDIAQYLTGSFILAILASILAGVITFACLTLYRK